MTELLDGYTDERAGDLFRNLCSRFVPRQRSYTRNGPDEEAKRCDRKLCEEHLLGLLVRQPSLHRHSLQAFPGPLLNEPGHRTSSVQPQGSHADFGTPWRCFSPYPSQASEIFLPNNLARRDRSARLASG